VADVVVLGTGGGGLVAALAAADRGARVCVLEKASTVGGTTAVSGGVIWFPCNHREAEAGIEDDPEEAIHYITTVAAGRSDPAWIETYVRRGPDLVRWLEERTEIVFTCLTTYPDYHPELEGGRAGGRSLDNGLFDTRTLGDFQPLLRKNPINGQMPIAIAEAVEWGVFADPFGFDFKVIRKRAQEGIVHGGASLVGKLLRACLDRGVTPLVETPGRSLITDSGGRVVGVVAEREGAPFRVRADRGVVLATGGFEWDPVLCKAFLPLDPTHPVSPPHQTGDALRMTMALGADLGNMPEAWWTPAVDIPGERYDGAPLHRPEFSIRCLPHSIIVNRHGERFTNEAGNYNDMTKPFFAHDPARYEKRNVPAWVVVDAQYMERYMFATAAPGFPVPDYVHRADSLEALATELGIDAAGLLATVERFNGFCRTGHDADFLRGWSAFDRFYGDRRHGPNPNLGTLEKAPFYGLPIHPGSMGTKGGPKTNTQAQVLRVDGRPIEGLYAVGNACASLGGAGYAGAGITIGASLLGGWLAAHHALGA